MGKILTDNRIILVVVLATIALSQIKANAYSAVLPAINWTQRSDWKNVKTLYGAIGDGATDDTAAIQSALTAAANGGTVYFPAGTYKVTSTLRLTGSGSRGFGIVLLGCGSATTLRWYGASGADFFAIDSNPYGRYEGLMLDGRGLGGIGFHHHNTALFETSIRYKNVGFSNLGIGVYGDASGTFASAETSFENCVFNTCTSYGVAIYGYNEYDWTVSGCDFISCGYGVWCRFGNCYVRDCYFQGSATDDIYDSSPEHGCSVRRCKSTGSAQFVFFSSTNSTLAVQDCYVTGWTGTNGAMAGYYSALSLSYSRFVNPPDTLAPVRLWSTSAIIDCDNAAPSSPAVYSLAHGDIVYTIPAGSQGPLVGSASGANITTFINQEFYPPTTTYDAIRDFSAVGDGVHDDTTAIQNCINAAAAHSNDVYHPAIAYLPVGKYKITATLTIPYTGSWFTFGGSSYDTALVWGGAPGGTMVTVNNPSYVTMENMRVGHTEDGVQNNGIDIHQTYFTNGGKDIKMTYDGIYVYGKYQNNPGVKGLLIDGGSSGLFGADVVNENMVEGNLRYLNCAKGFVLGNITYEGAITVDDTVSSSRTGFLGIQTRLSTNNAHGVYVNESNNFVMSDWYQESNTGGVSLNGEAGDIAGRVTIQSPNTDLPPGAPFMTITDYNGKVFYGTNSMYADTTVEQINQTGTNPLEIVLFGNVFYANSLSSSLTSATLNTVGDWEWNLTTPADSYTSSTLSDMTAADNDLQQLGVWDILTNYPFVNAVL